MVACFLCVPDECAPFCRMLANGLMGYKVGEKTLVVKMAGSRGPTHLGQGRLSLIAC